MQVIATGVLTNQSNRRCFTIQLECFGEAVTRGCLSYFDSFPVLHISLDELIAEGDKVFVR